MKKFLKTLFLIVACLALGLAVGTFCTMKDWVAPHLVITVAGIVSGIGYGLAVILAIIMAKETKQALAPSITLQKHDTVLQSGVEYVVKKRGTVRPGEYTLIATNENTKTFTVRVNDFVKEYTHNTNLILVEGDRISARSGNVILR